MVTNAGTPEFGVILKSMKRVLIAAVLMLAMGAARAQKIYFIYIQSDNNTPFFVKMGEKVTSSTASGYLIVPKLVDSTYQFTVGRTGQTTAESRFSITINKQDRGFLLRVADGKLSLFDLQGMTSLQPLAAIKASTEVIGKRTDPFTVLLAQAANDPSLLEIRATPAALVETKKEKAPEPAIATVKEPEVEKTQPQEHVPDTAVQTAVAGASTTVLAEQAPEATEEKTEVVAPLEDTTTQTVHTAAELTGTAPAEGAQLYKRSVVTRRSESSTSEGFGLVFWDEADGVADTIRIVIPNQRGLVQKQESEHGDSKKFLDITNVDPAKEDATVRQKEVSPSLIAEKSQGSPNADSNGEDTAVAAANEKIRAAEKRGKGCVSEASEKEFFRLRKNMAAEETDEAMIKAAQKAFKKSCFSTEQIKNLSTLFLSASGKYHFFDAAYGYASDKEQFASLQAELRDDYYANRFKALIAQQ
jgi:hypothetical protein